MAATVAAPLFCEDWVSPEPPPQAVRPTAMAAKANRALNFAFSFIGNLLFECLLGMKCRLKGFRTVCSKSVVHTCQKLAGAFAFWCGEEGFGVGRFDDAAFVHEDDAVSNFAGKPHFMGYDEHAHAFMSEF